MLKILKLKNVALIEIIEINFEKGLNIFTGESGSGKSLILDSLNTLFGGTNIPLNLLIRPGKKECLIHGTFDISTKASHWLESNGYLFSKEIKIVRITSRKNNKFFTKYFINEQQISKKQVNALGAYILDFAGQSDVFLFNSQDYLKSIIDDLGDDDLVALNSLIKDKSIKLNKLKNDIDSEIEKKQKEKDNLFASEKMLQILEEANLEDENEILELKSKELVLANNIELKNSLEEVLINLNDEDKTGFSIASSLMNSVKSLGKVCKYDKNLDIFLDKLIFLQEQVDNMIYSLIEYSQNLQLNFSENSLSTIQQRLYKLQNLEKTFSLEISNLIQKRNELREVSNSSVNENYIKNLQEDFVRESQVLIDLYQKQSDIRQKIAFNLEQEVISSLKKLGLDNAIFKIDFDKNHNLMIEDKVNFLFSANPDQELAPLSKIISGGEMSRFLLALKSSISNVPDTLFFDEIDNGLSGKSLFSLLELVKGLSEKKQILCITHHPLLAAAANIHFRVEKTVINGLTYTSLKQLSTKKQRQNEIAELIGGGFDEAAAYASTLLNKAAA